MIEQEQQQPETPNPLTILTALQRQGLPRDVLRPLSWYCAGTLIHSKAQRHDLAGHFYQLAEHEADLMMGFSDGTTADDDECGMPCVFV